ncbi:hypothetical protein SD71_10630 [Cohnella kolymensis]|uniref:Phage protein n=1 Tax=Cohnella kolymensis TaxID=1590652 RepID=A0ABR5A5K5_9BACL|nr:hypothetical protein [Cohnella kolymensis]KIL35845.1 hypothetical protein SD71_10630 [Cohnella kolymensis]
MDLVALNQSLYNVCQRLSKSADALMRMADDVAQTDMDYNIALASKIDELEKSGGKATLIEKLAKGDPIVAQYGFKRLLADTKYDASKRALMALESEKSGIQTLLKTMQEV